MLEEIKKKVQEKTNNATSEIIIGVYRNMIRSHNGFCGCNYCLKLKHYVALKRYRSALNRRMGYFDYDYWDFNVTAKDLSDLANLKFKIKSIKEEKDALKTI